MPSKADAASSLQLGFYLLAAARDEAIAGVGEVVAAVEDGMFHVWSVDSIYDGVELLTGVPAGEWDEEKGWTENFLYQEAFSLQQPAVL